MLPQFRDEACASNFDLLDIMAVVWLRRWWLASAVFLTTVAAVYYVRDLPNYYIATALVSPVEGGSSPLANLSSQYGNLANMAGISVGGSGGTSDFAVAKKVILSKSFLLEFFKKDTRLPDLIAAKRWDSLNNRMIYDATIYDSAGERWVGNINYDFDDPAVSDRIYNAARSIIVLNEEKRAGFLSISTTHMSPVVAAEWSNELVRNVNEGMKLKRIAEMQRSIRFLREQIDATAYADLRTILFGLIQRQIEMVMLAETREEFVFATIDKAHVPFQASGPNRRKIVVLGFVFGLSVGTMIILIIHFIRMLIDQRYPRGS